MKNFAKKLLMPMLLMALPFSVVFSQTNYPQVKVIAGDTITLINQAQVKKINTIFLQHKECDSLLSLAEIQLKLMQGKEYELTKIVNFKSEIIYNDSIIKSKLTAENIKLYSAVNKENKRVKRLKTWLTASGIVNGIFLGLMVAVIVR